ncbi:MAG: type II/IV secretion system ATPase subunit [Candidatus Hadarchaeales archaeon]
MGRSEGCVWSVEQVGSRRVMRFRCETCMEGPPSLKSGACMGMILKALGSEPEIDVLLLSGPYEQEYSGRSLKSLVALALALRENERWAFAGISRLGCSDCEGERKGILREIIEEFYRDPASALSGLRQIVEETKRRAERGGERCRACRRAFLEESLLPFLGGVESNEVFRDPELLSPLVRPGFMASRICPDLPANCEPLDSYTFDGNEVRIYRLPSLQNLYHLIPMEHLLPPDRVELLQRCRERILSNPPQMGRGTGISGLERMAADIISELIVAGKYSVGRSEVPRLASSMSRFTAGLGIIETMLRDPKVQDVYVDSPAGSSPVHIYHRDHQECLTNIYITPDEMESLASKLRSMSGRPFSEANPVLDTNIGEVRISAICPPLSPHGMALALRRHKPTPWTLPQLVASRSMTPLAAGLVGLMVDAGTTVMVTGSRGAGKTSLLGAMMFELLPRYRILTIEDTMELPVERMRELGYKVQRMQVRQVVSGGQSEMSAAEALRAALRMGDSVIVLGEVRGEEARVLYEAMRIGAAGNSVMGTIHGSSPRDVFDRVVHDLGIAPGSFKATDSIVTVAPIRRRGSVARVRRMVQITSVGKEWREDPASEGGFEVLASYDSSLDRILPTRALLSGRCELLSSIAGRWGTSAGEVLRHLRFRSAVVEELCGVSSSLRRPELLEAEFVLESNLAWRRKMEEMVRDGEVRYKALLSHWRGWLEERIGQG